MDQSDGVCERLRRTVLNKFFRVAFRRRYKRTLTNTSSTTIIGTPTRASASGGPGKDTQADLPRFTLTGEGKSLVLGRGEGAECYFTQQLNLSSLMLTRTLFLVNRSFLPS